MAVVLTNTGTLLDLDYPIIQKEIVDPVLIGPSLHRIPRFNGHLCFDYSVLQHSIFCALHYIQEDAKRRSYGDIFARPDLSRGCDMSFYLSSMVYQYLDNQFECNEKRTQLKVAFTLYRCLYHDVTEVFISDVPAPIKHQYTTLDAVEEKLALCIDNCWLETVNNDIVTGMYRGLSGHAEPLVKDVDFAALETERFLGLPDNPGWITNLPSAERCRLVHWLSGMDDEQLYGLFERLYNLTFHTARETEGKQVSFAVVNGGHNNA